MVVHDVHSHAHEEAIPGTVNLTAGEGEETYYGQALFPVPSSDPNDPLQVSTQNLVKIMLISRSGLLGKRIRFLQFVRYTRSWGIQLCLVQPRISESMSSNLVSIPILLLGSSIIRILRLGSAR